MTSADPGAGERADSRLEDALAERKIEDPRPEYRRLLEKLRDSDAPGYEEAVRRYEEELLPAVAGGATDPLSAWLRYGRWLARRQGDGRTVSIDGTGKAETIEDGPSEGIFGESGASDDTTPSSLPLILHLPEDDPRAGFVLIAPSEPTDPQAVTRELLCG